MAEESTALAVVGQQQTGLIAGGTASAWKAQRKLLYPTAEEWGLMSQMCETIAKAQLGPEDIRGNLPKILTVVLKGWELGLSPMQALDGIHVIKGRTELSADLKAALAQQRIPGAVIEWVEDGMSGRATVRCIRPGRRDVQMSFSIEEAEEAGMDKMTWKSFGPAMLRAHVLRNAVKMQYPEIEYGFDAPEFAVAEREAEAIEASREPLKITEQRPAVVAQPVTPPAQAAAAPPQATPPLPEGAPADDVLPFTVGAFKGKKLSELTEAEFGVISAGYRKAIADAPDDAKRASKQAWFDRVLAWAAFRGVTA